MAMARISLFPDFKEFLRLLNEHKARYLVLGGYAVNYHGYSRTTGDLDIWIAVDVAFTSAGRRLDRAIRLA